MKLVNLYEQIAQVIIDLKNGDSSSALAYNRLAELQAEARTELGLTIEVPSATDLQTIHNEYNSSVEYNSSFASS